MFDPEFVKWFATLGVGGILAAFMFVFYRKDVRSHTELWEKQAERVAELTSTVLDVVRENTQSNARMTTMIEALLRRLDENHFEHIKRERREGR